MRSFRFRAAWSTPSCVSARRRGVPSRCNAHHGGVNGHLGPTTHRQTVERPSKAFGAGTSMPRIIKFVRTRSPASLEMRAMMLSRAYPRLPSIPASAHAARWPQGSSGRPHRQLHAERGRTWRSRRSTTTRNKWVVSLLVGVTVKAAPAPGPAWDLINAWIWAEVRENNSSRNSPSTRMLASCCHPRCVVPGSLSSGSL